MVTNDLFSIEAQIEESFQKNVCRENPILGSKYKKNWKSKNYLSLFFIVRMGRWVDRWVVGGDQNGPSIFLIFRYINKQDSLITNLASKVVYGHEIKSYEQFKF